MGTMGVIRLLASGIPDISVEGSTRNPGLGGAAVAQKTWRKSVAALICVFLIVKARHQLSTNYWMINAPVLNSISWGVEGASPWRIVYFFASIPATVKS